jgi:hypothetical protein
LTHIHSIVQSEHDQLTRNGWHNFLTLAGAEVRKIEGHSDWERFNSETYELIATKCPKLTSYAADVLTMKLSDLNRLLIGCINLTEINLSKPWNLDDEAVLLIAEKLNTQLRGITIDDSSTITDRSLVVLAQRCTLLRRLDLYNIKKMTDQTARAIAYHCHQLEDLALARPGGDVNDSGICLIAALCRLLRRVDISDTNVTAYGLTALLKSCPRLKDLNINGCDKIKTEGLHNIPKFCPNITILYLIVETVTAPLIRKIGKVCRRLRFIQLRDAPENEDVQVTRVADKAFGPNVNVDIIYW